MKSVTQNSKGVEATPEEIDQIHAKQTANLQLLKSTTAKQRIQKIKKIKAYLQDEGNQRKLEQAMYADFKKPATEVQLTEILPLFGHFSEIISNLSRWMRPKEISTGVVYTGLSAEVIAEPKGQALIISPWNYPFLLSISPLLYAISAGCPIILKPSELTTNTSQFMADMLHSLFDENEIRVVQGAIPTATHLLNKKWGHIFFTGSPFVGKIVMKAASKYLSSVSLELGGKSPCVVDETANLKKSAKRLAWGKLVNGGQTCLAPDYLLIHKSKKDEFLALLKIEIAALYGQNTSESESLARIISAKQFDQMNLLIDDAVEKGGKVVVGGDSLLNELFVAPTVIDNATSEMMIMQEEIFGPLLPVMTFDKIEEVPEIIAQLHKPLSMYICSKSKKNIDYLVATSTAGGTVVNDFLLGIAIPSVPFGGINNSGIGKANGHHGFLEFTNERSVIKRNFGHLNFLYPPYTNRVHRIIQYLKRIS